jgi:predicted amidohydrolase
MRVSLLQIAYDDTEPMAARVARVIGWLDDLAPTRPDLVVLPELWPQGGFAYQRWQPDAQTLDGPVVQALRAAVARLGAVTHLGSLVERATDGRLYNTSVLCGPDGTVLTTYRKIHRFGFGAGEASLLTPGAEVVTAPLPMAGQSPGGGSAPAPGPRVGLATCYDLRFPELFRALLDAGALLVAVPAAWPAARVDHWRLLVRARAVEEQVVMVACNTAGTHAGLTMGGSSLVVDAWGRVLVEAGTGPEVCTVEVDLADVERVRAELPVLADRRLPFPPPPIVGHPVDAGRDLSGSRAAEPAPQPDNSRA